MPTDYEYCAGVLPYTNYNHCVYFLLGKSKRTGRLITFSGKNNEFESDPIETAAREFYEESLGAIMDRSSLNVILKKCDVVLHSTTPRGKPCYTYVLEIPFRKYYSMCFTKTRAFLECTNLRSHEYLEMTDIKWVCARSMLLKIRRQWERAGTLTDATQWDKLNDICNMLSSTSTFSSWRRETQTSA